MAFKNAEYFFIIILFATLAFIVPTGHSMCHVSNFH